MGYPILIKQLGHFRCNHVSIVGNRDQGDFLTRLRCRVSGGRRILLGILILRVAHS